MYERNDENKNNDELIDLMLENYCIKPMTVPLAMTKAFYYEIEKPSKNNKSGGAVLLELPDDAPIFIVGHLLSMDAELEYVCLFWKSNHYSWEPEAQMARVEEGIKECDNIENFNIMMNGTNRGQFEFKTLKRLLIPSIDPVAMTSSFRVAPHAQTTMIHRFHILMKKRTRAACVASKSTNFGHERSI